MYVLTRAINEYDQNGDYFVSVFEKKPLPTEIIAILAKKYPHMGASELADLTIHILNGGGRRGTEYEFFYLVEMNSGDFYEEIG